MMNDKKMKLIDKLKSRYPKLENDPLMEDLEAIMYEDSDTEGMDYGEEEEEEPSMDYEEEGDEMVPEEEEEESVEEEGDFLTDPDEDEDMDALMIAMGKPKKRRKM